MPFRLNSGVLAQTIEQQTVLLDSHGGLYFELNTTGSAMLQALLHSENEHAALEKLTEEFDTDAQTLIHDLQGLVKKLREQNLLLIE
jgi:Coenzyme PQQ synthesis protein D (PqqD)